ncbi:fanconi-associated nuclease 1 homolog isoform X2 [Aricia agestis]|nr:fanconi-associated nuclease 1 homolog isoform X2 [Aricia agestis]
MSARKKRKNLSLNKASPTKISKHYQDTCIPVINLDSDEENYLSEPFSDTETKRVSISSESTIIYSPETPKKNVQTSKHTAKQPSSPSVTISEMCTPRIPEIKRETVIVTPPNLVTPKSESKLSILGVSSSTPNIGPPEIKKESIKHEPGAYSRHDIILPHSSTPLSVGVPNVEHAMITPDSNITTPKKSPKTSQSSTTLSSPRSSSGTPKKFFSPTKKRASNVKRTNAARKNLTNSLIAESPKGGESVQTQSVFYEKTNFTINTIVNFVNEPSLNTLLNERSVNLLKALVEQLKPSVRLVCNLYTRKDRWFKWNEIKLIIAKKTSKTCDDIGCHQMLSSLLQSDVIAASNYQGHKPCLSFDECVDVLKKGELFAVCQQFKLKPKNKQHSIELLKEFSRKKSNNICLYLTGATQSNSEARVLHSLSEKLGACFKLSEDMRRTLDELFRLMYLGINYDIIKEKKLDLTIMNDITLKETFPYKNARTDNASVVFETREEFERYLNALSIYDEYNSTSSCLNYCDCVKRIYQMYRDINEDAMKRYVAMPVWLHKFAPPYIFNKILEDGIKFLKQEGSPESISLALEILSMLIAQTTFRQHKKLEWYSEKALILDKFQSKPDEAAFVLLEGLNLEHRDEAKDVLRKRASLLAKRKTKTISPEVQIELLKYAEVEDRLEKQFDSKHIYKAPMENSRGGKLKFETRLNGEILVQDAEDFCLSEYLRSGEYTHGGHWEGRIITTIFFLLLWDEIYNQDYLIPRVPGVVLCQYQVYPLDLHGEGFYRNRKKIIEHRLKEIQSMSVEKILEEMKRVWDTRPEYEVSGINRAIPYEVVSGAAECVGGAGLAALCRRLATCYGHAHSGFPDLTVFNCHTKKIMFVEVKTDSDRPSMRQLQWMQFLRDHNLPVQFCYVGTETAKCKARS